MDPNATLEIIRTEYELLIHTDRLSPDEIQEHSMNLVNAINDLDLWISQGGFLPTAWAVR